MRAVAGHAVRRVVRGKMRQLSICCRVYLHIHGPRGGDKVRPQRQRCRHSVPVVLLILRSGKRASAACLVRIIAALLRVVLEDNRRKQAHAGRAGSSVQQHTLPGHGNEPGFMRRAGNERRSGLRACIWLPSTPLGWQL